MQVENPVIPIIEDANKLDNEGARVPSRKTVEEQNQEFAAVESSRKEFLKEQGIELLPDEALAKMSFGEVLRYKVMMRDKIFNVQKNLPPNDFKASQIIFDAALSKVDMVRDPSDLQRLKERLGSSDVKKAEAPEKLIIKQKQEAIKGANIKDADILDRLSKICGLPVAAFDKEKLKELLGYVSKDKVWENGLGWVEWSIPETGDTFFVNPDGSMGVKE